MNYLKWLKLSLKKTKKYIPTVLFGLIAISSGGISIIMNNVIYVVVVFPIFTFLTVSHATYIKFDRK